MPRFSLRTLMIVVTVAAMGFGLLAMFQPEDRLQMLVPFTWLATAAGAAWKAENADTREKKNFYIVMFALIVVGPILIGLLLPAVQ